MKIDIDEALLKEAMQASGAASEQETVERGLQLLVRMTRHSGIRKLRGKLRWQGSIDSMRRDPKN